MVGCFGCSLCVRDGNVKLTLAVPRAVVKCDVASFQDDPNHREPRSS